MHRLKLSVIMIQWVQNAIQIFFFIYLQLTTISESIFQPKFIDINGICYIATNEKTTFGQGRELCSSMNATQLEFRSASEHKGFTSFFSLGLESIYLGLKRSTNSTNGYITKDGSPTDIYFWSPEARPNDGPCLHVKHSLIRDNHCKGNRTIVCQLNSISAKTKCPYTNNTSTETCYVKLSIQQNYTEGKQLCEAESNSLPEPGTATEYQEMFRFLNQSGLESEGVYLGMKRIKIHHFMYNSDKSTATYFEWATGQPRNRKHFSCVTLSKGQFHSDKCSESYNTFCQKKQTDSSNCPLQTTETDGTDLSFMTTALYSTDNSSTISTHAITKQLKLTEVESISQYSTNTKETSGSVYETNITPQLRMGSFEKLLSEIMKSIGCFWIIGILGFTIVSFFILRIRNYERTFHLNEELSLLFANVVMLFFSDKVDNKNLCSISSAILLYLYSVEFLFFTMESLHVLSCSENMINNNKPLLSWRKVTAIGWIMPAFPVGIVTVMEYEQLSSKWSCWLNYNRSDIICTIGGLLVALFCCSCVMVEASNFLAESLPLNEHFRGRSIFFCCSGLMVILPLNCFTMYFGSMAVYHMKIGLFTTVFGLNIALGISFWMFHTLSEEKVRSLVTRIADTGFQNWQRTISPTSETSHI